ncbi:hypothetical protein CRG98_034116 [Punica granatum]|uniref:Protein OSB1, mitochondrial n=1 Tax=Punica granatum TaxID=22663 RepID=A0A2I0IN68_PUNGR|nr:hypothetical protein CRG98_034116 [Punica granatum]
MNAGPALNGYSGLTASFLSTGPGMRWPFPAQKWARGNSESPSRQWARIVHSPSSSVPSELELRPPLLFRARSSSFMEACRLRAFTRSTTPSSLGRFLPFSSSARPRPASCFSADEPDGGSSSAVYEHALKFQRPTVIKWQPRLENKASLIGTVQFPLKRVATRNGSFGVHTVLSVHTRRRSNRAFWMRLKMWNEMAEISWEHLKPNDFIYVSGQLGCYTKAAGDGQLRANYEVIVHELNYVAKQRGQPVHRNPDEMESGASPIEKRKERLLLWQVFFANPYEWWDNRKHKSNSRQPDFKHKDTHEALWLQSNDPPWVKRQLELLDSKMEELGPMDYVSSQHRVSTWEYDE